MTSGKQEAMRLIVEYFERQGYTVTQTAWGLVLKHPDERKVTQDKAALQGLDEEFLHSCGWSA